MRIFYTFVVTVFCLLGVIPSYAQDSQLFPVIEGEFEKARNIGVVQISKVINADRFLLNDGRILKLAAIRIPASDSERPKQWQEDALIWAEDNLPNKRVRLYTEENDKTRYGDILAHGVLLDNNMWLQGLYISQGWAYARPNSDTPHQAKALYSIERKARGATLGLWADNPPIITPADEGAELGRFAIVEGRVYSIGSVKNRIFLNFGKDWRTDLTVSIPPKTRKLYPKAGIDLFALKGRLIRARGWIEDYNGPSMEILHPSELEVIDE